MKERLSRVYLDNTPVTLMGDESAPPLSRIVRAGGKRPDYVDVLLLASPHDKKGRLVELEEIIDRAAEPTRPIYLRTIPHDVKPIYTVHPGRPLSPPDIQQATTPGPAMSNLDPVIAQLGAKPIQDRPDHEEAVFRAPSQFPQEPLPEPTATSFRTEPGPVQTAASGLARLAEKQAKAEAEAEQRQEDERNHEDTLQDEAEAVQESDEDAETQT